MHLYNLPYDEQRPVVCFDELPVQLLGEVAAPLPMKGAKACASITNTSAKALPSSWLLSSR